MVVVVPRLLFADRSEKGGIDFISSAWTGKRKKFNYFGTQRARHLYVVVVSPYSINVAACHFRGSEIYYVRHDPANPTAYTKTKFTRERNFGNAIYKLGFVFIY